MKTTDHNSKTNNRARKPFIYEFLRASLLFLLVFYFAGSSLCLAAEQEAQFQKTEQTKQTEQTEITGQVTENTDKKESAPLLSPSSSRADTRRAADVSFSWGSYFQAIAIMLVLLLALWFTLNFIRKSGKLAFLPKAKSRLRDDFVIETQIPIAPKKSLTVVRFLDTYLVLGLTDQAITLLHKENIHKAQGDFEHLLENTEKQDFSQIMQEAQKSKESAQKNTGETTEEGKKVAE